MTALLTRLGFLTPTATPSSVKELAAFQASPKSPALTGPTSSTTLPTIDSLSSSSSSCLNKDESIDERKPEDVIPETEKESNKENLDGNQVAASDNVDNQSRISSEKTESELNTMTMPMKDSDGAINTDMKPKQNGVMKKLKKSSHWITAKKKSFGASLKKRSIQPRKSPLKIKSAFVPANIEDKVSLQMCHDDKDENETEESDKICIAPNEVQTSTNMKVDGESQDLQINCSYCKDTVINQRSNVYKHYALYHFREKMLKRIEEAGSLKSLVCNVCGYKSSIESCHIQHMAVKEEWLEDMLPPHLRIMKHKRPRKSIESTEKVEPDKKVVDKVTGTETFECISCDKVFPNEKQLFKHYSLVHLSEELTIYFDEKNLQCKICQDSSRTKKELLVHVGIFHQKVSKFIVQQFDSEGRDETIISNEEKKMSNKGRNIYQCHICLPSNASSFSRNRLYMHFGTNHFKTQMLRFITNEKICTICHEQFYGVTEAVRHVAAMHNKVEDCLSKDYHIKTSLSHKNKKRKKEHINTTMSDSGEGLKRPKKDNQVNDQPGYQCKLCLENKTVFGIRGTIYKHYSKVHFKDKLLDHIEEYNENGEQKVRCLLCGKSQFNVSDAVAHVGCFHEHVDKYLSAEYQIPKGKGGVQKKNPRVSENIIEEKQTGSEVSNPQEDNKEIDVVTGSHDDNFVTTELPHEPADDDNDLRSILDSDPEDN